MTTHTLKTHNCAFPFGDEGDECFRPKYGDAAFKRYLLEGGVWKQDGRGDWRPHKSGGFAKVPLLHRINGYTSAEYRRWLDQQGFITG